MQNATTTRSPAAAAAFRAAARADGVDIAALLALHPSHPLAGGAMLDDTPVDSLRQLLIDELHGLEQTWLRDRGDVAPTISDAEFYARRRRVHLARRRNEWLETLPSLWRRIANLPAGELAALLTDLGVEALARAMRSLRPNELPEALNRLDIQSGRRVLQRVIDGAADWPSDLRRAVRTLYLATADSNAGGEAVIQRIGYGMLSADYALLSNAARMTLTTFAMSDLRAAPDAGLAAFSDKLKSLVRDTLAARHI